LKSEAGHGALFRVFLPAAGGAPGAAADATGAVPELPA
jgi:hypothetical protein